MQASQNNQVPNPWGYLIFIFILVAIIILFLKNLLDSI